MIIDYFRIEVKEEVTSTGILAFFRLRSFAGGTSSITMTIPEIINEGQSLESKFDFSTNQIHLLAE